MPDPSAFYLQLLNHLKLLWEVFITRAFTANIKITLTTAKHSWTEFTTKITHDFKFLSLGHSGAGMTFIILYF